MSDAPRKMAPRPSPETQPFWDGCAAGELRMQRCRPCDELYFPPRSFCPRCLSDNVAWEALSGRGTLHTYLINHRAAPGFEPPYAIAVVQLDEGPQMMTNIVGVEQTPEALELDMAVEVTFEERGDVTLPLFAPTGAATTGARSATVSENGQGR